MQLLHRFVRGKIRDVRNSSGPRFCRVVSANRPILRIAPYILAALCVAGFGWTAWLAVRVDVDERVHKNVRTVPMVGNDLNELLPFGPVYAKFNTHPHGGIWGVVSGRCSEDAFREIYKNWKMQPLEIDVEMSNHFLEPVPIDQRHGLTPSDVDVCGMNGTRVIDQREVRLDGVYFPTGGGFVLKVQSSR